MQSVLLTSLNHGNECVGLQASLHFHRTAILFITYSIQYFWYAYLQTSIRHRFSHYRTKVI